MEKQMSFNFSGFSSGQTSREYYKSGKQPSRYYVEDDYLTDEEVIDELSHLLEKEASSPL